MSEILEIRLKGGLLLGGSTSAGLHDATLRDADGVPYLPASALKGAIREQMVRLVGEEGTRRVLGGNGVSTFAGEETETTPERFGGGSTRVYLGDAVLEQRDMREIFVRNIGYGQKTQVAIDRNQRRSAHRLLFEREIVAPFSEGLRFRAEADLSLLAAEDRRIFEAAVRAVFALGAGRTGGLGGCEMALRAGGVNVEDSVRVPPDAQGVELVLEAVDPLNLGVDLLLGNFQRTLGLIPASALRGAIATAALEGLGKAHQDQQADPSFRAAFLDPERCLRFSDAWPTVTNRPRAVPLTLTQCKMAGTDHGTTDTLLRSFYQMLLARHGLHVAIEASCPECAERMVFAKGSLGGQEPERRIVTRLELDRRSGRAADGQLYSLELLERNTRFLAMVAGLEPSNRGFLEAAVRRTLRVGHGRGQGYGRLRLVEVRAAEPEPLGPRLERFDRRVRADLHRLAHVIGLSPTDVGAERHYLAATLLSDLVLETVGSSAHDAFLSALGLTRVEAIDGRVRTGQRGGWDARRSRPKPYLPTLRAGSVVLLATDLSLETLYAQLETLELRGAGAAREEGFGWVRLSDPIHLSEWRKP